MVTEFQLGSVIVRDGDENGVIYYHTRQDKYFDKSGQEISLTEADRRVREESGFLMLDSIVVEDAIAGLQKLDESKNTQDPEKARLLFLQGMEFLGKANVRLVEDWESRAFSSFCHVFGSAEDMRHDREAQLQIGRTQIPIQNPTRLGSGAIMGFTSDPWQENLRTGSRVGESRGAGGWGTAAVALLIGAGILWRSLKKPDPDVVVPELFPELVPDLEIEVDGGDVGRGVEEEGEEKGEGFFWEVQAVTEGQDDDDSRVAEKPAPAGPTEGAADPGEEVDEVMQGLVERAVALELELLSPRQRIERQEEFFALFREIEGWLDVAGQDGEAVAREILRRKTRFNEQVRLKLEGRKIPLTERLGRWLDKKTGQLISWAKGREKAFWDWWLGY